jgi:hypothetical protein
MAKSVKNKKAIRKIEKAVKKAVRKGIAEEDVECRSFGPQLDPKL